MNGYARSEGVVAFLGGLTLDDNPYTEDSPPGKEWAEGWRSAREADEDDPAWR